MRTAFMYPPTRSQTTTLDLRRLPISHLVPRLRSGFRQQAPAPLTPAKRLKFDSAARRVPLTEVNLDNWVWSSDHWFAWRAVSEVSAGSDAISPGVMIRGFCLVN